MVPKWDPNAPDPDDEFAETKVLLGSYFDEDKAGRYEMEGIIATGASGIAWLVRYTGKGRPRANDNRIVLKIGRIAANKMERGADEDGNAVIDDRVGSIVHEGRMLELLRFARHIVKGIFPENDPLGLKVRDLRPLHMQWGEWLYMEYLENLINSPQEAAAEMVYQAGLLMYGIIIEHRRPQAEAVDPRSRYATFGTIQVGSNEHQIQTCATRLLSDDYGRSRYLTLEDDLIILVCHCMARNMRERPTLAELMQRLNTASRRGEPYYTRLDPAWASRESDENVSRIVQRLIFNA
ncbi:hypothetical protein GGR57DRAFT_502192 [Xylariaceae sp. FL1272]|nr:hypothetical protein GGR57DRAFT_502192 [Xylariaceae sp. FL1272]